MSESRDPKNDRTERERDGAGAEREGGLSRPDEYGANEREQTIERERAGRTRLDDAGEVTDAEIEAREERPETD